MPITERQLQANRENLRKRRGLTAEGRAKLRAAALRHQPWRFSTGPSTQDGKQRSRGNAVKRGEHCRRVEPYASANLLRHRVEAESLHWCRVVDQSKGSRFRLLQNLSVLERGDRGRRYRCRRAWEQLALAIGMVPPWESKHWSHEQWLTAMVDHVNQRGSTIDICAVYDVAFMLLNQVLDRDIALMALDEFSTLPSSRT